jgi:chaperonin GroEL (HSP60 family)
VDVSPADLRDAVAAEWGLLQTAVASIVSSGARIVLNAEVVGDAATQAFARHGIVALGRLGHKTLSRAAHALGGRVLFGHGAFDVLAAGTAPLGHISLYEEVGIGSQQLHLVHSDHGAAAAIVLRGPGPAVLDEAQRSLEDALLASARMLCDRRVVVGGGAVEAALAVRLQHAARTRVPAPLRRPVAALADSLLNLAIVLTANAGLPAASLVTQLHRAHRTAFAAEQACHLGIDLASGQLCDMRAAGVLEPAAARAHAVAAAVDAACAVLGLSRRPALLARLASVGAAPARERAEGEAAAEGARQARLAQRAARRAPMGAARVQPWFTAA